MSKLRTIATRLSLRPVTLTRSLGTTTPRFTQAGYGDPQDEKADNHTPLPSSTPDPQPAGQGQGPGQKSGSTDPEVSVKPGKTGNQGGDSGDKGSSGNTPSGQDIRETKKIGENPKKEEVGSAGPIGG